MMRDDADGCWLLAVGCTGIFSLIDASGFFSTDQLVERIVENREQFVSRNKAKESSELDYIGKKEFVAEH
jgi:hypothetical protein